MDVVLWLWIFGIGSVALDSWLGSMALDPCLASVMLGISGWGSRAWYLWVGILGAEKTHGLGICRVNRLEDYELFGLFGDLSKLEQTN